MSAIATHFEQLMDVAEQERLGVTADVPEHMRVMRLLSEYENLRAWKLSALAVESWWSEVDRFVRSCPDVTLGQSVSAAALHILRDRYRIQKALAAQSDHWSGIEAIAKEFGIGPDMSLASENLPDGRWSYNDPCSGKLFREDEVVDEILRRIAELKAKTLP